jgi:hypothetical protein
MSSTVSTIAPMRKMSAPMAKRCPAPSPISNAPAVVDVMGLVIVIVVEVLGLVVCVTVCVTMVGGGVLDFGK